MNKKILYLVTLVVAIISIVGFFFSPQIGEVIELEKLNKVELTELKVEGATLFMNNEINSQTPKQLKKVFKDNPNIETVVMGNVPGSIDDDANLEAAEWISKKNLTFILNSDSEIASGGTDFFLAGKKRIIYDGAKVGIHSWGAGLEEAKNYKKGHKYHLPYIEYYKKVGMTQKESEDFYYFTIYAASASDIYWMTNDELVKYGFVEEVKK